MIKHTIGNNMILFFFIFDGIYPMKIFCGSKKNNHSVHGEISFQILFKRIQMMKEAKEKRNSLINLII